MTATDEDISNDDLPALGETVAGKYVITRKLDEGGMGVLFAATHRALDQQVAIKFLRSRYARDSASRERFLREARAAAAITSQHAARIYDVDETPDGIPFIVMELLRGADLGKVVATRGKLPPREAVGYVLEACEAIAEAHAAGVVHRDLKPSNLFLVERPDGTTVVKVLDFGISKSFVAFDEPAPGTSLTAPNTILGSPHYMSPEQVRNAKTVDHRSDVWALGIIVYELVAGVTPFDAESAAELFAKILADVPPPLRKVAPATPPGLSDVVMRCLVKEPAQRMKSVADLAVALRPFAPEGSHLRVERINRASGRPPAETPTLAAVAPSSGVASPPRVVKVVGAVVVGALLLAAIVRARASATPPVESVPNSTRLSSAPSAAAATTAEPPASIPSTDTATSSIASAARDRTLDAADKPTPSPSAARKQGSTGTKLKELDQIQLLQ